MSSATAAPMRGITEELQQAPTTTHCYLQVAELALQVARQRAEVAAARARLFLCCCRCCRRARACEAQQRARGCCQAHDRALKIDPGPSKTATHSYLAALEPLQSVAQRQDQARRLRVQARQIRH